MVTCDGLNSPCIMQITVIPSCNEKIKQDEPCSHHLCLTKGHCLRFRKGGGTFFMLFPLPFDECNLIEQILKFNLISIWGIWEKFIVSLK